MNNGNNLDNHGIGDNPRKGQMYYDPNFDKKYVDRDRHGLGDDQSKTQTYYDPGFDKGYIDLDTNLRSNYGIDNFND